MAWRSRAGAFPSLNCKAVRALPFQAKRTEAPDEKVSSKEQSCVSARLHQVHYHTSKYDFNFYTMMLCCFIGLVCYCGKVLVGPRSCGYDT